MATVYVSYRTTQMEFVKEVVALLEPEHRVCIDYKIPPGADWRQRQRDEMRSAEVFVVFVSADTHESDYQNMEMGEARFCSHFLDSKLIIPVVIDDVEAPRPLNHLDYLAERHRDPVRTARDISDSIKRRVPTVRLFISHAHRDADLASRVVDVLDANSTSSLASSDAPPPQATSWSWVRWPRTRYAWSLVLPHAWSRS